MIWALPTFVLFGILVLVLAYRADEIEARERDRYPVSHVHKIERVALFDDEVDG